MGGRQCHYDETARLPRRFLVESCEMRPREYPDGDLAVLAGDCILEIPRYLKTLTVDWRVFGAVAVEGFC